MHFHGKYIGHGKHIGVLLHKDPLELLLNNSADRWPACTL